MKKKKISLGYILANFPSISEVFILREICELKKRGIDIYIFSLRKPKTNVIHDAAKNLLSITYYRPFIFSLKLVYIQFLFFILYPFRYISLLIYLIGTNYKDPIVLAKSLYHFPTAIYFAYLAKKLNLQHIHAHFAYIPATVALITSKFLNVEFSFSAHAWDIYVNKTMLSEKMKAAKFIVTCSDYNRKSLLTLYPDIPKNKVIRVYHGIDLNSWKPESNANELKPNKSIEVISVGRLEKKKGFIYLVKACKILKEKGYKFKCNIVGTGSQKMTLEKAISSYGLEKEIKLRGTFSQEELIPFYKQADLFVLPSVMIENGDRDVLPNVLIEALAMNIPAISSYITGIPEIIEDRVTGILVPERNEVILAEKMEELIDNRQLRNGLSENGLKLVKGKFDIKKNVKELEQLFLSNLSDISIPIMQNEATKRFYYGVKRIFDVAFSVLAIAITIPLYVLFGILIKCNSEGPLLFNHTRVGKGGKLFTLIKFRTMFRDVDKYAAGPVDNKDPRITRVGFFLRNHGLDELPQLFNVIKGDMSLVGPRPEMPMIVKQYKPLHKCRLTVMPGITGLWQINRRRGLFIHDEIGYDLDYIKYISFKLDFAIILKTILIMIFGRKDKKRLRV